MTGLQPELRAIALILVVAALASIGVTVTSARSDGAAIPPTPAPTPRMAAPTPVPAVISGPLDGLPTVRTLALRRPVAVVLDDFYPDARPLTGIGKASVVFETLVEGGITRLMALYLERDASRVGPIRSTRPYFDAWAAGFGALFVHAGGSPAGESLVARLHTISDIDALAPGPEFFQENDRAVPHNLYGSTAGARAVAQRRGQDSAGNVTPLPHGSAVGPGRRGRITSITLSFSTPTVGSPPAYDVAYRYGRARNLYLRWQGGVPFVDRATGKQVAAANVLVLSTKIDVIPNDPEGRLSIAAVGRGQAVLFQNGRRIVGTWSKAANSEPLDLATARGPMTFVPGQTWIEVAPPGALQQGPGQ